MILRLDHYSFNLFVPIAWKIRESGGVGEPQYSLSGKRLVASGAQFCPIIDQQFAHFQSMRVKGSTTMKPGHDHGLIIDGAEMIVAAYWPGMCIQRQRRPWDSQ